MTNSPPAQSARLPSESNNVALRPAPRRIALNKAKADDAFMDQVKDMFPGKLIGPDGKPFPKSGAGPTDSANRRPACSM